VAAGIAEITERERDPFGGGMNQGDSQRDSRKDYESPKLVIISLRPEEAVLGHCKISGGSGPNQTGISGPCEILLGGCTPLGS
jgi:hypothetical protein